VKVNESPANDTPADSATEQHASVISAETVPGTTGTTALRGARSAAKDSVLAPVAMLAAWIVPGAGHLILGRWGRALGFLITVAGLAMTGALLRGKIFAPHSGDLFDTLGFLADAASGVCYYVVRLLETAGPDVSRAAGDYGTRFIAGAGVVNLLAVFDALEIASGRRA
jgi:hypothetical protein